MKKKDPLPVVGYNTSTGAQYVVIEDPLHDGYVLVSTANMYPRKWWAIKSYIKKYEP
jgi:hypothetical protein